LSTPPDGSKAPIVIAESLEDLPGCDPPVPLSGLKLGLPSRQRE